MDYSFYGEEWSKLLYSGYSPSEIAARDDVSVSIVLRVVEKYRYSTLLQDAYDDD